MKNFTNLIGYITAFAIMVSCVFKFNHFPGAGTALMLTGLLLSIYFPVFIIDKMRENTNGQILPIQIAAALSASFLNLGITLRLLQFPGAAIFLILGLAGFALVFMPMLLHQKSKEENADHVMNGAGALGLSAFALGTLFKLQHWVGAPFLLASGPAFLFLVYFPKYILQPSVTAEVKSNYLRQRFFVIVIGTLCALYFKKSIEIYDAEKNPQLSEVRGIENPIAEK